MDLLLPSSLETLYLYDCSSITNDGLCSILSNNLTNLQSLDIRGLILINKETISKMILPSSLTDLNMSSIPYIDNNSIIAMMSNNNLSNLTKLNISYNPKTNNNILSKLLPSAIIEKLKIIN